MYLLHRCFNTFFFHWSDLVRNAYYHLILFRTMLAKQSHLLQNRLSPDEVRQYRVRGPRAARSRAASLSYDPQNMDLAVLRTLSTRITLLQGVVEKLPPTKKRGETMYVTCFAEFMAVRRKYSVWEAKERSGIDHVPKIITAIQFKGDNE